MQPNYKRLATICHLSRNTNDLQDGWESMLSIMALYGENVGYFADVAGPGFWNDPDEVNDCSATSMDNYGYINLRLCIKEKSG